MYIWPNTKFKNIQVFFIHSFINTYKAAENKKHNKKQKAYIKNNTV